MPSLTLLVLDDPAAPHLRLLALLPDSIHIAAGKTVDAFEAMAPQADVIFVGIGMQKLLREVWPMAPKVRWVHSFSAGVESLLFPEMAASPVPVTNGSGVFSRTLGEFCVAATLYFAKDFRRMVRSQEAGLWDQFDVQEIHGKTMGIVGYGDIGRAIAQRAHGVGMRVVALRRRPELSADDPYIDQVLPPDRLHDLLAMSDYVSVAAPITAQTRGMIGEAELRAMKPSAVILNVGRGPVIVEAALIRALQEGWIRGAALDVFDHEPVPADHPFFKLPNVLLSPHCADHTDGWIDRGMEFFAKQFDRFVKGEPLDNLVDKVHGY